MKRAILAIAILVATVAGAAPALAEGPRASSSTGGWAAAPQQYPTAAERTTPPEYQWQYHYVGRHARYREEWVRVR